MAVTFTPGLVNPRVEPIDAATPTTALRAKRATVTFDATWAPYIQGTLVCRGLTAAEAIAADPRLALGVKFQLEQSYGTAAKQTLPLAAWLRTRSLDVAGNETTLTFASVESVMQDGDAKSQTYTANTTDVAMINQALFNMRWDAALTGKPYPIGDVVTVGGLAAATIAAADAGWPIGTDVWTAASRAVEQFGYRLYGDETGTVLQRSSATYSPDTSVHLITGTDRVLRVTDTISRDSTRWADRVTVYYKNGTSYTTEAARTVTRPQKAFIINRSDRNPPTSGPTPNQAAFDRMNARGRQLQVAAIADLTCRPNQTYRVQYRGYDWTGTVQSVTFTYPDGLMDMTLNINNG